MTEDIKRLREAAQAVLNLRGRFPEQDERAQAIDIFQMAAQPELLLRLLDDAERYQHLRNKPMEVPASGLDVAVWHDDCGDGIRGEELDMECDDEIRGEA
jgi:hypothetical protein